MESKNIRSLENKSKELCEQLRLALPRYDKVMSTMSQNSAWWDSFQFKTESDAKTSESLLEFAARCYTTNNPAELGILVVAYAHSSEDNIHLLTVVENLVVSDSEYTSTSEGLDCLLLLAHTYTDLGHPRKAWVVYRKGLTFGQLLV